MKSGELVLLLSKDETYLVEVSDKKLNTSSGTIDLKKLRKKKFGDTIKTHLGKEFSLVKPTIRDVLTKKAKRLPQIVMPKDATLILAYIGIEPGSLIVDAGTGKFENLLSADLMVNNNLR